MNVAITTGSSFADAAGMLAGSVPDTNGVDDDPSTVTTHEKYASVERGSETKLGALCMISIGLIDINDYNPNILSPENFGVLTKKTSQLARNPMPIKVRPNAGRFTIINGEHNFKAALEVGLTEVLCEVEDVDMFEAMKQTLDYNRHGEHNPLREGLVFQQMMQERNLSQRELAKEIDRSEAKIRTGLKYVEAAAKRISCAPAEVRALHAEHAKEMARISTLSNEQVRMYVKLPECWRDVWRDAGASMDLLKQKFVFDAYHKVLTGEQIAAKLIDSGLLHHVDPTALFGKSLQAVAEVDLWCGEHIHIDDVYEFANPVIDLKLPPKVLESLPLEPAGNGNVRSIVTVEQWTEILTRSCNETKNQSCRMALISNAISKAISDAGRDPADALTQRQLEMLEALSDDAPSFIADASFMSIEERYRLHRESHYADREIVLQAKQLTVEQFKRWRSGTADDGADDCQRDTQRGVVAVFKEHLEQLLRELHRRQESEFYAHPDRMIDKIMEMLRDAAAGNAGTVDGRPAIELMREDLAAMPHRSLVLMAACVVPGCRGVAIKHWQSAAHS